MKNFKLAVPLMMLCSLSFISLNSLAADNTNYFYLGGGVGYGRVNGEDFTNTNGDLKKSNVSWKATVGAKLNNMLSLEGQYIDFGAYNRDDDRIEATGWTAGIVLDFFKDSPITPYGKVGALFWDADNRFNNITRNQTGTDGTLGLGLRFALSDHLAIRTEYERFMMDNADVDNVSAVIQYHFF